MQQFLTTTIFKLSLFLMIAALLPACSKDDDGGGFGIDCTVISLGLEATIVASTTEIIACSEESINLIIAGTPSSTVTYSDGTTTNTVEIGTSGTATVTVTPMAETTYSISNIMSGTCEKVITGEVTITAVSPLINENLVGTWSVENESDGSSGGTVTFLADGTGTSSEGGAFREYSDFTQEYSIGFAWTPNSAGTFITFLYKYQNSGLDTQVGYAVEQNDCDEVILRNTQTTGDTHILTRQ